MNECIYDGSQDDADAEEGVVGEEGEGQGVEESNGQK